MTKTITASPEDLESLEEEKPKVPQSRRGAKPITAAKPKGASRVLFDSPVKTSRPISVYLERVTDVNSGSPKWHIWYHTEDSKTIGQEEISRINPRTEEEFTLGHDYTINASVDKIKELMKEMTSKTKFYHKDGEPTLRMGLDKERIYSDEKLIEDVKALLGVKTTK